MSKDKILVIENSLEDRDLIARQALKPLGHEVRTAELVSSGIQLARTYKPDLIITNLSLPDLSGKDLLVALRAQNIDTPVVLVANVGQEQDVIQAFHLGAADVIRKPLREAEIVATAERALQSVRTRREREQLVDSLQAANAGLKRRIRDLNILVTVGKGINASANMQELFDIILDGAASLSGAQRTYFLVRASQKQYLLAAYRNLPKSLAGFLHRPFDDGISSLVVASGKPVRMHGAALQKFKIASLGKSVLVVPVRTVNETIALLVSIRTADRPFGQAEEDLLQAVADYAGIAIANLRRLGALEEKAEKLRDALDNAQTLQM